MEKRGQVTIFIIIGIILLIILALFLYFRGESLDLEPQEKIPSEFVPVRNLIEECMQVHAKEGIYLLGIQGGYTKLPIDILYSPDAFLPMDTRGYLKFLTGITKKKTGHQLLMMLRKVLRIIWMKTYTSV